MGGYLSVSLCNNGIQKTTKIHKLVAMAFLGQKGDGCKFVVNHKNFIRTDNRSENLELVSMRENTNQKHLKSRSKFTGVIWDSRNKKWRARIHVDGKLKHLGLFVDEIDAHLAYQNELSKLERNNYSVLTC